MKPTVTLLVSTYNWKEALSLSLSSALSQTVLPDEIVVADDGSTPDTLCMIEKIREQTSVPIVHVWHEDQGFRKTTIYNKALAKAKGEYIVQIDGDVILNRYFIQDHLELAEEGYFICGSRVKLGSVAAKILLDGERYDFNLLRQSPRSMFNGFRSKILRQYLAKRYSKNNFGRLRGCNTSYWRADAIKINGYNEDLTMWGHEDTEFAYRLFHAGVQKKFVKMGGVVFHIHHKVSSNANEHFHFKVLDDVIKNRTSWCENGINKYLEKIE